jgi:CRP-like cAMP-binding protein
LGFDHRLLRPLGLEADPAAARLFEACAIPAGRPLPSLRKPTSPVYFLRSGVVSMTGFTRDGRALDLALIGRDGFTGAELVLADPPWSCRLAVQAAGRGWRVPVSDLTALTREREAFRAGLLRYVGEVAAEIAATALACCHAGRTGRVALWIARMQDLLGGEMVETTHDVIANAIGAHRPGVTAALHLLEEAHLIRLGRGRVHVLDRAGLLAAANGGVASRADADPSLTKVS